MKCPKCGEVLWSSIIDESWWCPKCNEKYVKVTATGELKLDSELWAVGREE